jgi:hypothetical protein
MENGSARVHTVEHKSEELKDATQLHKPVATQLQEKPKQKGGAQPGAGRPAFVPTDAERQRVEELAGCGVPEQMIAALIRDGIHVDTLRARLGQELIRGRAKAAEGVGRTLYARAMAGDVGAMVWYTKTQMRWSPAPQEIRIQSDTRVSIASALDAAQARVIEGEAVERVVGALGGPGGDAEGDAPPEGERE